MTFSISCIQILVVFIVSCSEVNSDIDESHTCLVPEEYYQTISEERTVKIPKTEVSWCWNPKQLFKCTRTYYVNKKIRQNKPVLRTRLVAKCCPGYEKRNRYDINCVPSCRPMCSKGICIRPNECYCSIGYFGKTCSERCPSHLWGRNCENECKCVNDATCDYMTGSCICKPGWRGPRCELPCEDGYYGLNCNEKCNCSSQSCDFQTGTCISTTTEPADKTTENTNASTESSTETLETLTFSVITITEMTISVNNSLYGITNKNYEEKTTTNTILDEAKTLDSITQESEGLSTVEIIDVTNEIFYEVTTPEAQTKKTQSSQGSHLETVTSSEVAVEANTTKETVPIEETHFKVKILQNLLKYDKRNTTPNFKESEIRETEKKFLNQNGNSLIKNTTSGEYITNFSKEIEVKNDGDTNKNYDGFRERSLRGFQFMPSLIVLSGVSVLIITIGIRWLIRNRKKRKYKIKQVKEEKLFNPANLKFTESVYSANSFYEEPIVMTDLNLNEKEQSPVFLTFKPDNH